jgi:hypothetical protein
MHSVARGGNGGKVVLLWAKLQASNANLIRTQTLLRFGAVGGEWRRWYLWTGDSSVILIVSLKMTTPNGTTGNKGN